MSLTWLDTLLTWLHIAAGALVLLSGVVAMVAQPKGAKLHRLSGQIYVAGMAAIFISAVGIIALFRFNLFLLVIAVFSFYMTFSGVRVLAFKKQGKYGLVDYVVAALSAIAGLALVGVGAKGLYAKGFAVVFVLCIGFGLSTLQAVWANVKIFSGRGMSDKRWWFFHHMQNMLGSYIAAFTAFTVQNGDNLMPNFAHAWLFWVLPPVVGSVGIVIWSRYYHQKFKSS